MQESTRSYDRGVQDMTKRRKGSILLGGNQDFMEEVVLWNDNIVACEK